MVQEGIDPEIFESIMAANGCLSQSYAEPKLVPKSDTATEWDEPRLTINYSRIEEDLPGTNITYLREVHKHLSNPRIGCLSIFGLKHAYWSIQVRREDRHILAFETPVFPQLQPTRMPQGSKTSGFTMTNTMLTAFSPIP